MREGESGINWENCMEIYTLLGFPGSSAGKEFSCNAGDTGLVPGSESSPGEGKGYPLLLSWASLVAETVKNPPAVWETWVRSLGREDPLAKGMATHSSFLPGESQRLPHVGWRATVIGVTKADTTGWLSTAQHMHITRCKTAGENLPCDSGSSTQCCVTT